MGFSTARNSAAGWNRWKWYVSSKNHWQMVFFVVFPVRGLWMSCKKKPDAKWSFKHIAKKNGYAERIPSTNGFVWKYGTPNSHGVSSSFSPLKRSFGGCIYLFFTPKSHQNTSIGGYIHVYTSYFQTPRNLMTNTKHLYFLAVQFPRLGRTLALCGS